MDDKLENEKEMDSMDEIPEDPYLDELDQSLEGLIDEESPDPSIKAAEAPEIPPAAEPPRDVPEKPQSRTHGVAKKLPVQVHVVVGEKQCTLADLFEMEEGQVLELDKSLGGAVDLMVRDKVVARGELVQVDGQLGVRIIRVVENE
jgi:flagellar motor switch protein FliN